MRILFATPVVPSRAYGRRPYNFLRYLRGRHDLTLATFLTNPEYDRPCVKELESWGIDVRTVNRPLWRSALSCLTAPIRVWPLRATYCRSSALKSLVRGLVKEKNIEVLHIDRKRMGQYGFGIENVVRVVDFTDDITLFLERKRLFEKRISWSLIDWWEYRTIPGFEDLVLRNCEAGLLCSPVDNDHFLSNHPGAQVHVIPNVVDPEEFHPKGIEPTKPCGVYSGTLSYAPNIDALEFLVNDILPEIRREVPDFTLKVYGTRPGKKIYELLDRDGIVFRPDVPKLSDELIEHDLYLCPIRIASGMRNKILEAMAVGMAVVTTEVGAEGLDLRNDDQVVIRDDPHEFGEAVVDLLKDEGKRKRTAESGRNYVLQNHLPEVAGESLENLYRGLLAKPKRPQSP